MLRIDAGELDLSDDGLTLLYRDEPFTGIAFEHYPDGRDETEYLNGQKWGVTRRWSAAGVLVLEENVACNARHGTTKEWHPNGAPKLVAAYELGIAIEKTGYDLEGGVIGRYVLEPDSPQFETLKLMRQGSVSRAIEEWQRTRM